MEKRKITREELDALMFRLVTLRHDFGELGMMLTYHAMHAAIKQVGYEMAEVITGKHSLLELGETKLPTVEPIQIVHSGRWSKIKDVFKKGK